MHIAGELFWVLNSYATPAIPSMRLLKFHTGKDAMRFLVRMAFVGGKLDALKGL